MRLQHLTPVPCGASLAQIAGRLVEGLDAAAATRRIRQGGAVAERFREERAALRALPERSFEAQAAARRSDGPVPALPG